MITNDLFILYSVLTEITHYRYTTGNVDSNSLNNLFTETLTYYDKMNKFLSLRDEKLFFLILGIFMQSGEEMSDDIYVTVIKDPVVVFQ